MQEDQPFKVAVVGGGIGGASSAYFLRQIFGNKVSITLFEKSGRIGGRIKTVPFCGETCESGASAIHSSNYYMYSFANQFKIPMVPLRNADQRLLLFEEGYKPVFSNVTDQTTLLTPVHLLWRYGFSLLRARLYLMARIREFTHIYALQQRGECFASPGLLLEKLSKHFPEMTKCTYAEWMRKEIGLNENYINELGFGILSSNYCQNSADAHAFVGVISSACTVSDVFTIENGAEQIPQKLVEVALAGNPSGAPKEFIHATVKKITRTDNDRLCLSYDLANNNKTEEGLFDYVILSLPLHQESNISTSHDIKLPSLWYHEMCRTFLSGQINYSLFDLQLKRLKPNQWATFLPISSYYSNEKHPVRSITRLPFKSEDSDLKDGVWSIFSEPKYIPDPKTALSKLILKYPDDDHNQIDVVRWLAYPTYHPVNDPYTDLGQFKLASRVYYPNAIESTASCMEMAIIGGRNVALLIANEMKHLREDQKSMFTRLTNFIKKEAN
ncbi:hypothetical protein Smp_125500 [Schistosoma mansoni]|uniref:hypothetical protein n=1 Tax=Schistosoma mansoni TaxID=6183 RepID=UPI0001A63552|nr:hypothetical protein Smp_125500 [Schistosoma mansoni]|eukprot:XP_018650517.1 hypothetical protein Smp_125500 [Schistosoma mansoni]